MRWQCRPAGAGRSGPLTIHLYGSIYLCMKTTIEIEDGLMIRAKKRAAELRKPLRALIEQGLREQLKGTGGVQGRSSGKIKWVTEPGGLPGDLEVADRVAMQSWLTAKRK